MATLSSGGSETTHVCETGRDPSDFVNGRNKFVTETYDMGISIRKLLIFCLIDE